MGLLPLDKYQKKIFVFCNANLYRVISKEIDFREELIQNTNIFADGVSVYLAEKNIHRLRGADGLASLGNQMINFPDERVVFFGSTWESLLGAARRFNKEFGIDIAGIYSPPIMEFSCDDDTDYCKFLHSIKPTILIVALGAPKQERFSLALQNIFPQTRIFCLGAAVDFFSGHQSACPLFLRKLGFEWLWRMLTGGIRIRKRIISNVSWALVRIVLVRLRLKPILFLNNHHD